MKLALILFLFGFPLKCFSQNLIINPSFEDTINCPNNWGQIERANGWYAVIPSPDYFNSCATIFDGGVPTNYLGFAAPVDGNAYVGFATYDSFQPDAREILGTQLSQPLTIGIKYFLSVCIIRADTALADCVTDKFGFKFSNTYWPSSNVINNFSHFHTDSIVIDKINWTKISGSFIADSAYQYLYLGNFYTDANINVTQCSVTSSYHYGYNLIDMVCVSADSTVCSNNCSTNVGLEEDVLKNSIAIFPNPFDELININGQSDLKLEFVLYDQTGKIICGNDYYKSAIIETKYLSPGLYFYKIESIKGTIKIGKLVKL